MVRGKRILIRNNQYLSGVINFYFVVDGNRCMIT